MAFCGEWSLGKSLRIDWREGGERGRSGEEKEMGVRKTRPQRFQLDQESRISKCERIVVLTWRRAGNGGGRGGMQIDAGKVAEGVGRIFATLQALLFLRRLAQLMVVSKTENRGRTRRVSKIL